MNRVRQAAGGAHWVVVANEAAAVFYARNGRQKPLVERERLCNEAARLRSGEIKSDRDGRVFDSHGAGRHGLGKELHGPKQHAAEAFARRIAARVEAAQQAHECRDYTLVAAPRFLGALRGALARTRCPAPLAVIDKDVADRDTAFIEKLLEKH